MPVLTLGDHVPQDNFQIIAPDRRKHLAPLCDLLGKVFSHNGYFSFRDYSRKFYVENAFYDWDASRIGLTDGLIVTHWGVWDYPMRIGRSRVRTGGIGAVATHGDYRKHGLMDRTARESIEAMRRAGYDMTILFGIRNFYHRFGYVRAWSETSYIVALADLPAERPPARIRSFSPPGGPEFLSLYNRQNAQATGTAVRPTYLKNRYPGRWKGYCWRDDRGKLAGYVITAPLEGNFECVEACGDAETVLGVLARLGRRGRCREIRFNGLPHDGELARRLRQGNCRCEVQHHKNGGAMIHLINLPGSLQKLSGELSARLRQSHLAGWRGKLLIARERDAALLDINRTAVRVSPRGATRHSIGGGQQIAQLLIGTDEPEEIIEAGKMRLSGDARELVKVLFPSLHPMLSTWDRY